MPLQAIYGNYQFRKSQYIKYLLTKKEDKDIVENGFFRENIEKERKELAKRIKFDINNSKEFSALDNAVAEYIFNEEIKLNPTEINGETSYNMANHFQFRHLIYFEFILPISKKEKPQKMEAEKIIIKENS